MGDDSPLGGLGKTAEQNRGGLPAACGGVRHVR